MFSIKILLLLASVAPPVVSQPLLPGFALQVDLPGPAAADFALAADFTEHAPALPGTAAADVANLKEQLEAGLRARRPQEFAFIGRVVSHVEQGQLTVQLVTETFQWARNKKPYPFPYFERAMTVRAAKLGVDL